MVLLGMKHLSNNMLKPIFYNSKSAYILANKIIIVGILLICIYVFSVNIFHLNIRCQYKMTFNRNCFSCGLTRGLFKCFENDFQAANTLNSLSVFFYLYGIMQFSFRNLINFILVKSKSYKTIKIILMIDTIIFLAPIFLKIFLYG